MKGRPKNTLQEFINCFLCFGKGEKFDSKQGKIRDCVGCKGTGKIKNPNFVG